MFSTFYKGSRQRAMLFLRSGSGCSGTLTSPNYPLTHLQGWPNTGHCIHPKPDSHPPNPCKQQTGPHICHTMPSYHFKVKHRLKQHHEINIPRYLRTYGLWITSNYFQTQIKCTCYMYDPPHLWIRIKIGE